MAKRKMHVVWWSAIITDIHLDGLYELSRVNLGTKQGILLITENQILDNKNLSDIKEII